MILPRLAENGKQYKDITLEHLDDFAKDGLRTLVLAYKEINEQDYQVRT